MSHIRHLYLRFIRHKQLRDCFGESRSGTYQKIADGLLPKPVRLGARSVGFPEHEVQAVLAARIAGHSDDQIRALVAAMAVDRAALFNASALSACELQSPRK